MALAVGVSIVNPTCWSVPTSKRKKSAELPPVLLESSAQLGLTITITSWAELDELQRFALVKLSHPGHEHRNLPRALTEFGLLESSP